MNEIVELIIKLQALAGFVGALMLLWWIAAKIGFSALEHSIKFKKCLPVWREMILLRRANPDFFEAEFVDKLNEYKRKAQLYDMNKGANNGRD